MENNSKAAEDKNILLCVLFAQFDNKAGPKITYQTPERFLEGDAFEEVSKLIIPKPFLCGSLISFCKPNYTVLGCPVILRDAKYHRNALLFNFCFVLKVFFFFFPTSVFLSLFDFIGRSGYESF